MKLYDGILPSLSILIQEVLYICGFGTHINDFVGFANRKNPYYLCPKPLLTYHEIDLH